MNDEVTDPNKVHRIYEGLGKQRAWNPLWISVPGLLRFHTTLILLTINPRSCMDAHFSTDAPINSPIAQIYTKTAWQQTMRYLCAYDPTTFVSDRTDPLYNPYAKYEIIYQPLQENIRRHYTPGQELSYDEGGKPYRGKGGHGIAVHYNPMKPNKRMSMVFILASGGIPIAWEMYVGEVGNKYNEAKYNTSERMYGITVARILRLTSHYRGKWHHLYMDNAFSSVWLFFIYWTVHKIGCASIGLLASK